MKKLFLFLIFLLFAFLLPQKIFAFTASAITNHGAPTDYVYPDEFDKLVLDVTLATGKTGQEDKLQAIALQNEGTARVLVDIAKLILWKDAGEEGFQGLGVDEKIGEFNFYSENYSWYLKDLNLTIPVAGLRVFVSAEIKKVATLNKSIRIKLSALLDHNNNSQYDNGDLGVYLASANNGPSDNYVLNPYFQTVRLFSLDNLMPKAVIVSPAQDETIATSTYRVKGEARDQGGSTPQWVKISLSKLGEQDVWHEVIPTSSNYSTWEYEWANIAEGVYSLKTKAKDWMFNEGASERIVRVKVEFPPAEPEPESITDNQSSIINGQSSITNNQSSGSEPEQATTTPSTIEQLKAEIARIQQLIIDLLKQLIEIIQSQIIGSVN